MAPGGSRPGSRAWAPEEPAVAEEYSTNGAEHAQTLPPGFYDDEYDAAASGNGTVPEPVLPSLWPRTRSEWRSFVARSAASWALAAALVAAHLVLLTTLGWGSAVGVAVKHLDGVAKARPVPMAPPPPLPHLFCLLY